MRPTRGVCDASPPSASLLTKILLFVVVAVLLGLLGVGGRGSRVRVSFPGPRIPESMITGFWFVGCLASFAAGVWFMIRGVRDSAREDVRTAFTFGLVGSIMAGIWLHRRRTGRGAA